MTEASTIDLPAWRHARGLSQPQLGNLLDVPVATVRNWERGRARPHGNMLRLALAALDAEKSLGPTVEAMEHFDEIQEHAPAAPQPDAINVAIESILRQIREGR